MDICLGQKGTPADHDYKILDIKWVMDKEVKFMVCILCGKIKDEYTGRQIADTRSPK